MENQRTHGRDPMGEGENETPLPTAKPATLNQFLDNFVCWCGHKRLPDENLFRMNGGRFLFVCPQCKRPWTWVPLGTSRN